MTILFVDQLTVIDFSYFHPQRGIVGESWILDVKLGGDLDNNGMVFDFTHVKKQIKQQVDQLVDHKFLFPAQLPNTKIVTDQTRVIIETKTSNGLKYRHISPDQAIVMIPSDQITRQTVLPYLKEKLFQILPSNVKSLELTLREESIDGAYYHYSHGLKKHFGDCQRIAHGHRSKIEVFVDGARSELLENQIASDWKDIYLITREDILKTFIEDGIDYISLGYHANQGEFNLTLPRSVCEILETDSTVELIAEYLARKLKKQNPEHTIQVKAYEGVQKGAIAEF